MVGRENGDEERPLAFHPQYTINVGKYKRIFEKNSKKFFIEHFLPCFALSHDQRTAAGPQQGRALDASRKLALRAAFSAVVKAAAQH